MLVDGLSRRSGTGRHAPPAPRRVAAASLAALLLTGAASCDHDATRPHRGAPAWFTVVSGNRQTGFAAEQLADPLVVAVGDSSGVAMPGVPVAWRVVAGGGQLGAVTTLTDAAGRASVTWTLGATTGADTVTAGVVGLGPQWFTATAVAGQPVALRFTVQPGAAIAGVAISPAVEVSIEDAHGNRTTSTATVAMRITDGTGTPAAHLGGDTGVRADSGLARFPRIAVDSVGTAYTLTARSAGLSTAVSGPFDATAAPGGLDLDIPAMYVTQATQTVAGSVPLVAGRDALLRVFARANETTAARPAVRVRLYQGGALLETDTLAAPATVPTSVIEDSLTTSWNLRIPGAVVQPGLAVLADVDPTGQVAESNRANDQFPQSGVPEALDVRIAPSFTATLIPVYQSPNGLGGSVTDANKDDYITFARRVYPLPVAQAVVHSSYAVSGALNTDSAWSSLIEELTALRAAEAGTSYYYGVIRKAPGYPYAGLGVLSGSVAIGVDDSVPYPAGHPSARSQVAAHEWGHNLGRGHIPCALNTGDQHYPYAGGSIGVSGFDLVEGVVRSPAVYFDVMSYCSPFWISDYTYQGVLRFRAPGAPRPAAERTLLVWGRMDATGIVLEPAFEITAPPLLPVHPGPYRLQALDSSGRTLLDLSFDGDSLDHIPGVRVFAFTVPLPGARAVAALRLLADGAWLERRSGRSPPRAAPAGAEPRARTAGAGVRVEWDAALHPTALIRDAASGEVLAIGRGGVAEVRPRSGVSALDVVLSDGVSSVLRRVQVPAP